jgi:hypothetical protein
MGGYGSGNHGRRTARPVAEECVTLRSGDLRPYLTKHARDGVEVQVLGHAGWQPVRVEASGQPFGGHRWQFRCPICGLRRRRLFLPAAASRFGCRRCHSVRYVSQLSSKSDQWRRRAGKLYRRAGTSSGADFHYKPRGMHCRTFNALIDHAEELEARAFLRDTAPFLAAIGYPLPADVSAMIR